MKAALAAALVCCAVWASSPSAQPARRLWRSPAGSRHVVVGVQVAVGAVAALTSAVWWWVGRNGGVGIVVMLLAGGLIALLVHRLVEGVRTRRIRRQRSRAVIELCDALAAELRAGLPAVVAIERAVAIWPAWSAVVTAARLGGDVPGTLRAAGAAPGARGLRAVAAGWEVAERTGAALADVLDHIGAGLRSDDDARSEVVASLAPPRATAKMLAVLPAFGLALGAAMEAHPVDFLLHTTVGLGCLGGGIIFGAPGSALGRAARRRRGVLMTWVAALMAAAAGWWAVADRSGALGRLIGRDVMRGRQRGKAGPAVWVEDPRRRGLLCVGAVGAFVGLLAGMWVAALAAIPAGLLLSWWLGRLEPPSVAAEREQTARDLPVAVDLVAACSYVGRPLEQSLEIVAAAVGGPLGARLEGVTARLALGADPRSEWQRVGADELMAPLARTMSALVSRGHLSSTDLPGWLRTGAASDVRRSRCVPARSG